MNSPHTLWPGLAIFRRPALARFLSGHALGRLLCSLALAAGFRQEEFGINISGGVKGSF